GRSPAGAGYDAGGPSPRLAFDARRKAFYNLRPAARIPPSGINLCQRRRLRPGQTFVVVSALAPERLGIEVAGARIFDQAIFHPVEATPLPQHRLLNCSPPC